MASTTSSTVEVTCPECGTVTQVSVGSRAASDFCPSCDYPLFWASSRSTGGGANATTEDALYRAPGTSGTTTPSALICPACGERNATTRTDCVRCGSLLNPPPPAPPAPTPPPEPVVVVNPAPVVRCDHWPSWAVATLAASVTLLLTVAAFLIFG